LIFFGDPPPDLFGEISPKGGTGRFFAGAMAKFRAKNGVFEHENEIVNENGAKTRFFRAKKV
jgi:hypothetical protein